MGSHWYPRYVGDYAKDTAHLSLMEHGAFTMLLDWYYSTGKPLPANWVQMHRICKAVAPDEQEAVRSVVEQFFKQSPDGWHNDRADVELLKRSGISEKRRLAQAKREQIRVQNQLQIKCKRSANAPANAHTTTTTIEDISNDISIHAHNKNPSKGDENGKPKLTRKQKAEAGSRIDDWFKAGGYGDGCIPPDWHEWAHGKYGWDYYTVQYIAEQFIRYFTGPDAKEPVKKDWKRAFQGWCDRSISTAQAFIRSRTGPIESQRQSYSSAVASSSEQARGIIAAADGESDEDTEGLFG